MVSKWFILAAIISLPLSPALAANSGDTPGQTLVDQEAAQHSQLALLSLHTIPPGAAASQIIASTKREKVGKKSDPDDLEVVKTGKPEVKDMPKRQIFDLLFPLQIVDGKIVGTIVMEVKYGPDMTADGALKLGSQVASEIRKQVKSKEALFQ